MDLEHMLANPLASDCSPSVQSQRLRRRDKRRLDDDNAATDHQPPGNTCIAAELANIYQADRQHSLLALQIPTQNRSVVPSSEFISMHDLLLSQSDYGTPEEKQEAPVHITELILRDFCSSPTYEEEENIPICDSPPWFRFRKKTIKTYSRKPPTRKQQTVAAEEDEEDRLSCSSGLSVQEDHTAVAHVPATTALCGLDANSSQKICENLLNLSEYFSVSNAGLNPNNASTSASAQKAHSIDLPIKQETPIHRKNLDSDSSVECTSEEFENLEEDLLKHGYTYEASEVCDIKQPPGNETNTLFGESESIRRTSPTNDNSEMDAKACGDWSEGDSFLANYNSEKMSLSNDEPIKSDKSDVKPTKRLENPQQSTYFTLEDIPMSEWQTIMEVPDVSSIKTEASDNQSIKLEEMGKIEARFLEEIPDWKPKGIALRTASNKPSEVSEENAKKAAKLLSDIQAASDTQFLQEITLSQWPGMDVPEAISEVVGFRTASNKPIEISEEMKKRGAMLLADVEGGETDPPKHTREIRDKKCFSEDMGIAVGFRTASNKPIEVSEEMKKRGAKLLADVDVDTQFLQDITLSQWPGMDVPEAISEVVGFRTASNKPIEISEEMKKRGAMLLADVEGGETDPPKHTREIRDKKCFSEDMGIAVGFRTASNKPIEVSEEMKKRGAKLLADVDVDTQFLQDITLSQWPGMDVPEAISEVVGFRTASNKPIEISEEMRKRGAMLLADVEGGKMDKEFFSEDMGIVVGFRTASNKPIEVSEENAKKAAKLLSDIQAASDTQFLQDITLSQWPGMDVPEAISEVVGFRTASNKPIEISEEMRKRGAMLLADVEGGKMDKEFFSEDMGIAVGFRTASNKPIEVSEENAKKAAKLLSDIQAASDTQFLQDITLSQWPGMDVPEAISEVVGFRTASNKPIEISEEMKKRGAMLLANVHATEQLNYPSDAQFRKEMDLTELDIPEIVSFRTATSKPIEVAQEMIMKPAELMTDIEAESTNEPSLKSPKTLASSEATEVMDALTGDVLPLNCEPECLPEMSDYLSGDDFKGFPSGKCQPMDLFGLHVFPRLSQTVEYSSEKAPANDARSGTPKQRRETSDGIPSSKRRRRNAEPQLSSSPQQKPQNGTQLSKTTSWHSALGSPINSQRIPASLSQLAERSPLDRTTKTSVIGRRNLLSLSKRRKRVSTVGECQAQDTVTPVKPRFAPMSASTSTPLSNRNINLVEEYRGGEDVSPICMPPQKAPRIGLSRSRY
ncbi:breast cancer type 2 susceptibility protein homolog isoform X3 [Drosophila miranda]|uniref:breast cancer type 2 susceptibility protein homolog isoform X3 n=1 Tax=Drosophila miranda TaxID=7229 RepID=UPI00143F6F8B|nr:breast cancer type 2 susceptibility protein homolog isoform X3 [Drosophila miranda]